MKVLKRWWHFEQCLWPSQRKHEDSQLGLHGTFQVGQAAQRSCLTTKKNHNSNNNNNHETHCRKPSERPSIMYKLSWEQRLWSFKTPPDFKKTTAPWELRRKELKSLQGTEGKGGRTPWCLIITPTHGLSQRRTRLEDLAYPPAIYRREHGGYHGQPL